MSVFAIADLHLSTDGKKTMTVFGPRWTDYIEKIEKNWKAVVTDGDVVVVPGDISWGLRLDDTTGDFTFLNSLPGIKLLGKGNHDFWWATAAKMNAFFEKNHFDTFRILYNNAYETEEHILCGTRGWFLEEDQQKTVGEVDYARIVARETLRLTQSLDAAKKLQETAPGKPISVFLHFPPVWSDFVCAEFLRVLREYDVKDCYFGHIHGVSGQPMHFEKDGIRMHLISADALNFLPYKLS